jgi:hypothetical protein
VHDGPSVAERVAYRALGVRLDEKRRPWVIEDLDSPAWVWKHLWAQLLTFGIFTIAVLSAAAKVLGEVPWAGAGGFVGALIGQVAFGEVKRKQMQRLQLTDSGWVSTYLPFPHRVVLAVAVLLLVVALLISAAFAIRS